jgi:hypothetical protein
MPTAGLYFHSVIPICSGAGRYASTRSDVTWLLSHYHHNIVATQTTCFNVFSGARQLLSMFYLHLLLFIPFLI